MYGLPDQELIIIVNKSYKVSGRLMIQDGKNSHIVRYKDEIEHNGPIGDPALQLKILTGFRADIEAEASQTTLPVAKEEKKPLSQETKKK